jgi:hypothetical protein
MNPFWQLILGGVLALVLMFAAMHLAWIATHIPQQLLLVLILVVCYGLYLLRSVARLSYGFLEVLIGVFIVFGTMGKAPQVVSDPATARLLLVQLAAGMYIIVRGFDNWAQSEPFAGGCAMLRATWKALWVRKRD